MARPRKSGMDYFPHDTTAHTDTKVEAMRSIYGNDGYAFYFIMLEVIYSQDNFEIEVSDAETRSEMFQILSKKIGVSAEVFEKMLNTAFRWGLFDQEKFEREGKITSEAIKKRAGVVVEKREKMRKQYQEEKKESKGVSEAKTSTETTSETQVSGHKEKKRKGTTSGDDQKEKNDQEEDIKKQLVKYFADQFQRNYGYKYDINWGRDMKIIQDMIDRYGSETVKSMIDLFFQMEDSWVDQTGRTIPIMKTKSNQLVQKMSKRGNGQGNQHNPMWSKSLRDQIP